MFLLSRGTGISVPIWIHRKNPFLKVAEKGSKAVKVSWCRGQTYDRGIRRTPWWLSQTLEVVLAVCRILCQVFLVLSSSSAVIICSRLNPDAII